MEFRYDFLKDIFLGVLGGFLYGIIEVLYKGSTHISMVIAGGVAFLLIGKINNHGRNPSLLFQMFLSAGIITGIELIVGVVVNVWLKLNVWDYSSLPFNLMGQICLPFSIIWFFLSFFAIVTEDYLRYWLMQESRPRYHLF